MKNAMRFWTLLPLVTALGGCKPGGPEGEVTVEYQGAVVTKEAQSDQLLEDGETIQPEVNVSCVMKPLCSDDIYVEWQVCLVEKFIIEGTPTEAISSDLNGNEICATVRTDFSCVDGQLTQGESQCLSGSYCAVGVAGTNTQMWCGWRIVDGQAYNADGSLIEGLTPEKIQSFGYDLFPVEQVTP